MEVSELQKLLRKLDGLHLVGQMVGSRFDDSETQDLIENAPADENENPFEICLRSERSEYLTQAIQKLSEKEQLVISLYYKEELTMRFPLRFCLTILTMLALGAPAFAETDQEVAARAVGGRLRFSNALRDRLVLALGQPAPVAGLSLPALRALRYRLSQEGFRDRCLIAWAEAGGSHEAWRAALAVADWSPPVFPIKAQDALDRGAVAGPGAADGRSRAVVDRRRFPRRQGGVSRGTWPADQIMRHVRL
jgi:hypothetical protein